MELEGHGCRVSFDGQTLTAEGTNKAAQMALRGIEHQLGAVSVPLTEVASVEHKAPSTFANGRLTVQTFAGTKYVLHFRRKHADGFAGLASALGANV